MLYWYSIEFILLLLWLLILASNGTIPTLINGAETTTMNDDDFLSSIITPNQRSSLSNSKHEKQQELNEEINSSNNGKMWERNYNNRRVLSLRKPSHYEDNGNNNNHHPKSASTTGTTDFHTTASLRASTLPHDASYRSSSSNVKQHDNHLQLHQDQHIQHQPSQKHQHILQQQQKQQHHEEEKEEQKLLNQQHQHIPSKQHKTHQQHQPKHQSPSQSKQSQQTPKPPSLTDVAELIGIYPELLPQQRTPPIPFHPKIEVIHPPSLFLQTNDSAADWIPVIWDIFIRDNTLVILLARYLEGYGMGSVGNHFSLHINYTISTAINDTNNSSNDTQHAQRIISLESNVYCRESIDRNFTLNIVQDFYRYGSDRTSVDAIFLCMIPISSIPFISNDSFPDGKQIISSKRSSPRLYDVTVDYLGFKKTFHLTPIEQDPATPSYSSTSSTHTKPFLFVSSMVGNKPLITATEIITWMQFHRRLGVDHFYLYYMYPLSELSVEHVEALNDYVEKSNVSLSIVQWHQLYYPTPSHFQRQSRGCSHLAILQSTLYRQKPFKGGNKKDRWMLEIDIDDFVVPHRLSCEIHHQHSTSKHHKEAVNGCFSRLPELLSSLIATRQLIHAVTFSNSYFYMMNNSAFDEFEKINSANTNTNTNTDKRNNQESTLSWLDYATSHMLPGSNVNYEDFQQAVIIRESDLREHWYRPKLIYHVERVLMVGPHTAHIPHPPQYSKVHHAGYYLHLLQPSRGRNVDMIKHPVKTCLHDISNGYLTNSSLVY